MMAVMKSGSLEKTCGTQQRPFCLSKMAKNEICAKVSKNLDTNVLQQSQSVQHYCNIAGDILV